MAKTNLRAVEVNAVTHEGGSGVKETPEKELTRGVSCLLLFEDTFYEKGKDMASRLSLLCDQVSIPFICDLAIRARGDLKLRHAPLWLMVQALRKRGTPEERSRVGQTISDVIQRADELAEILAIYWKCNGKNASVPRQLKAGIAKAFPKFNEYQLAKYNSPNEVKLRDALFLSHAKPTSTEMADLWKRLIDNKMAIPWTWETELSSGKDKKETFTKLIKENKLGYMALLRNLRNMEESGVDKTLVREALLNGATGSRALPFRFISAAKHAPGYADVLSDAMDLSLKDATKLLGRTAIVIDCSGSMDAKLSGKSEVSYREAGAALAVVCRGVTPEARTFAFGDRCAEVKNLKGLGLVDAVCCSQTQNWTGCGTNIPGAIQTVYEKFPTVERMIVVTDCQSYGNGANLRKGTKGYFLNVAGYEITMPKRGGQWTELNGWSERLVDWIREEERIA